MQCVVAAGVGYLFESRAPPVHSLRVSQICDLSLHGCACQIAHRPFANVYAEPYSRSGGLVWHGNWRMDSGHFGGCVFHFIIIFGKDYPFTTPIVEFASFPSPTGSSRFNPALPMRRADCVLCVVCCSGRLCLDTLISWRPALTVYSILEEMSMKVLGPIVSGRGGGAVVSTKKIEQVINTNRGFRCFECGHGPMTHKPELFSRSKEVKEEKLDGKDAEEALYRCALLPPSRE